MTSSNLELALSNMQLEVFYKLPAVLRFVWAYITPAPKLCVLSGTFMENTSGEVRFPEIPAIILERVCQYFYYKLQYQNT